MLSTIRLFLVVMVAIMAMKVPKKHSSLVLFLCCLQFVIEEVCDASHYQSLREETSLNVLTRGFAIMTLPCVLIAYDFLSQVETAFCFINPQGKMIAVRHHRSTCPSSNRLKMQADESSEGLVRHLLTDLRGDVVAETVAETPSNRAARRQAVRYSKKNSDGSAKVTNQALGGVR